MQGALRDFAAAARVDSWDGGGHVPAVSPPPREHPPVMTYIVTDACVKCKFMDCVEVCPVDCFYEGENFLVIAPDECIDCGVCEPECPAEAIVPDSDPAAGDWIGLNERYAALWPNISVAKPPPTDAAAMDGAPDKRRLYFSERPGEGDV